MLGGRHLRILQDAQEAVGKVSFRWDQASAARTTGRLRSAARQRVAAPPKTRQRPTDAGSDGTRYWPPRRWLLSETG